MVRKPKTAGFPIVVAVHGTWSPAAEWTDEQSPLLTQVCPPDEGWGLARFRWSGLNGITPRLDAAEQLTKKVNELPSDSPIVALGHSHGGNIIAWASTQLHRPLSAAVYLNTPFTQARQSKDNNRASSVAFLALALALSAGFFFRIITGPVFRTDREQVELYWNLGGVLVAFVVAGILSNRIAHALPRTMRRLDDVSTPERRVKSELSVFSTGDEIGTLFALTFASRRLLRFVSVACGITAMAGIVSTWVYYIVYRPDPYPAEEFPMPQTLFGSLILFGVLGVFLASAATFVMNVISYGLEEGLLGMDGDIVGTPAPRNEVHIYTVPWPTEVAKKDTLRKSRTTHSLVCEDPQVIDHISRWLRKTLSADLTR